MAVRRTHFSMCTSYNIRYFKSSLETAKLFLTPGTPGTSSLVNYQQTFNCESLPTVVKLFKISNLVDKKMLIFLPGQVTQQGTSKKQPVIRKHLARGIECVH